ncbi:phosphoglycerate kinase [Mycoplasma sp. CAG:776]|nr:phosphoglycerate kinase [Mycoplasma sp. CAG:776]
MKQLLKNMYVNNLRVILRCDFNVPITGGNITDESKIIKSLETINYLLSKNCKIIILSHLGRVKTEEDKAKNSLIIVKNCLERLLNKPIKFANDILSEETKNIALNLQSGEILLLENTRFLDVPNKLESNLNEEVAQKLASLGEMFVLDAFAVAHRNHTSVVGIPKYLPSCLGFLVEKEKNMLDKIIMKPERPFTVIMGGAKVDDKLKIINSLLPKCEHLLVSGGIANSFLSALGLRTGESLKTENPETIKELQRLMLAFKEKFAFPLDAITTTTYNENPTMKNINKIDANDIIKDIGIKTINKYSDIIKNSNTIFMNGTMGIYEQKEFANGTIEILNHLKEKKDHVVIGGGDTVGAVNTLGFKNIFPNISSGGGATLEYIANASLPGIEAITEEDSIEILDL